MTSRARSLALAALTAACIESGYVLSELPGGGQTEGGTGDDVPAGGVGAGAEAGAPAVAGAPSIDCNQPFQPGTTFSACILSYFGSAEDDQLLGAAIGPDQQVFLAGTTGRPELGANSLVAPGASRGVVLRLQGGRLVSSARLGAVVHDLEVTGSTVLAATDEGVFALTFALDRVLGHATDDGEVLRLAVSGDSAAALLAGNRALLIDALASPLGVFELGPDAVADVAFDAELGLLFVTGGHPAAAGGACAGSIPFLRALDLAGTQRWVAYDFDDAPEWCASSSGRRLALRDGKLFYAGEQHGGNSVHLRDPRDLSVQAPLVSYDSYSNGSGKAIEVYSFVARFDARSGALEAGQVILPRREVIGGSLSSSALAVDEQGRIFLGGQVSCCVERRDERTVAGMALGPFAGTEASLLVLSSDLLQRLAWTSFTGSSSGNAQVNAIAVQAGLGVLAASADSSESLLTSAALQDRPAGSGEGYFAVFPAP